MEPQRAARSRLPLVIGVLVVIALVVGTVAIIRDGDDDDDDPSSPGGRKEGGSAAGAAPSEGDVDAVVEELSAFVADVRQLELLRPVEVTLLEDEAFRVRVREDALADEPEELAVAQRVFRALGILDRDVDLRAALLAYLENSVVGFYDPETDDLVVRGGTLNAYVRSTLVHEIVHALDDQHFELHRPVLDDADDEAGLGFATLVEGNAVRVQELYDEQLSDDERAEYAAEQARILGGFDVESVPPLVAQLIGFPYLAGPPLARLLAEQGGERRVDEAFDAPPITSEQALDPASWLAGDAEPMDVPPPPADGEVIDQGTIGEWGLVVLLGGELGQEAARDAAAGWGGDWYVAWDDGDRTCVRATIVMDTPEDLGELDDALDEWASNQLEASMERSTADGGSATFTTCG